MKKLLIILLCLPMIGFGQNQTINVKVKKTPSFSDGIIAGAAARQARAASASAQAEAMKDNSSTIEIDLLINNSQKYSTVVLDKITGWKIRGNRKEIVKVLKTSETKEVINLRLPKQTHTSMPKDIPLEEILYLSWHRERITDYSRGTIMTLKDSEDKIVFKAKYKNIPYTDMLNPLLGNYTMTKKMAMDKIKEYKELLDMGIINQQEYDELRDKLKPIILGK